MARRGAKRVADCGNAAGCPPDCLQPWGNYLDTHTSSARRRSSSPCCQREPSEGLIPCIAFPFSHAAPPTWPPQPLLLAGELHIPLWRSAASGICGSSLSSAQRNWECYFLSVCAETCSSGAQHCSRASCVSAHRQGGKGQSARLQAIRTPIRLTFLVISSAELQASRMRLHERPPARMCSSESAVIHIFKTFQRSPISSSAFPITLELHNAKILQEKLCYGMETLLNLSNITQKFFILLWGDFSDVSISRCTAKVSWKQFFTFAPHLTCMDIAFKLSLVAFVSSC